MLHMPLPLLRYNRKNARKEKTMFGFIEKMTKWALEKEAEAAKGCRIDPEDIQKQIETVEKKREEIQEQLRKLDEVLTKLRFIKAEAMKCETNKA
jgi:cobalamin biosynthesis protein CbiD